MTGTDLRWLHLSIHRGGRGRRTRGVERGESGREETRECGRIENPVGTVLGSPLARRGIVERWRPLSPYINIPGQTPPPRRQFQYPALIRSAVSDAALCGKCKARAKKKELREGVTRPANKIKNVSARRALLLHLDPKQKSAREKKRRSS